MPGARPSNSSDAKVEICLLSNSSVITFCASKASDAWTYLSQPSRVFPHEDSISIEGKINFCIVRNLNAPVNMG